MQKLLWQRSNKEMFIKKKKKNNLWDMPKNAGQVNTLVLKGYIY